MASPTTKQNDHERHRRRRPGPGPGPARCRLGRRHSRRQQRSVGSAVTYAPSPTHTIPQSFILETWTEHVRESGFLTRSRRIWLTPSACRVQILSAPPDFAAHNSGAPVPTFDMDVFIFSLKLWCKRTKYFYINPYSALNVCVCIYARYLISLSSFF